MIRISRTSTAIRISLVMLVAMGMLLGGCAPEAPRNTPTPLPEPTITPRPAEPGATATIAPTEGGPSPTPIPTSTPRPAATPTSAPSNKPNTVYIPGGEFILGSDTGKEDETPQQEIYVNAFNIDIYPVTNAEYKEFVDASGHNPPRTWNSSRKR